MATSNPPFEALKGYMNTHGTFPTTYGMYEGQPVGLWLKSLADSTSQETPNDDVITFLKQKNWDWIVLTADKQFCVMLELLRIYVAQFGRLPKQKETFKGEKLGMWVTKKRHAYKKGKLTPTQTKLLKETRKWTWGIKTTHEIQKIFVKCYEKHGDISAKHVGSDVYKRLLGMRKDYMNARVSAQHSAKLEQWPGWVAWCSKYQSSKKLEWLESFKKWYGADGHIPAEYQYHPHYRSIYSAKKSYKNGVFSQNTRTELEKIPGWVEFCSTKSRVSKFDEQEWVVAFKENHAKHGELHADELSHLQLLHAKKVRRRYLDGEYSEKRTAKLAELPGWQEWCALP